MIHDFRYALRMLTKSPGFTVVVVLTLALGIGANSTIFSWISSTLLNPIPGVTHTANLVTVMRGEPTDHPSPPFSYPDFRDLRDRSRSFTGLLGYHDDFMSLTGAGKPERIYGALTSINYFDVLGLRPIIGRGFLPDEEQQRTGATVAVISYSVWQNHFGLDPSVVGKTIQINRHSYTIIGVTPREFRGCKTGLRTDIWIPLTMDQAVWGSNRPDDRGTFWLNVLGKLRPGITDRQAEAELNLLMQGIAERFPEAHRDSPNQITLDPLWRSPFGVNGYLYKVLPMLVGLAAVLLLLACANVANLLLVRSVARRREIAIRLSMGATRGQLVRQFLVESLMLSMSCRRRGHLDDHLDSPQLSDLLSSHDASADTRCSSRSARAAGHDRRFDSHGVDLRNPAGHSFVEPAGAGRAERRSEQRVLELPQESAFEQPGDCADIALAAAAGLRRTVHP